MSYAAEVAAIIRDAVIAGALVYVIQLMRQQIALLHQESKVKQSEIDVHKATIEHLTKFQAPAIARDLEQMTKTAENYAKEKAELERQVALLAKQNAAIDKTVNMAFKCRRVGHLLGWPTPLRFCFRKGWAAYAGFGGWQVLQRPTSKTACI